MAQDNLVDSPDRKNLNFLTSYELSSEYDCLQSGIIDKLNSDINQTAIKEAKVTILKPLNFLLIIMGWRSIYASPNNKVLYWLTWLFNRVYPIIALSALLCSSIMMLIGCQHNSSYLTVKSKATIECYENLLTFYVGPAIILVTSYLYILYLFRMEKSEHIANLIERVYLHYNQKRGNVSKKSIQRRIYLIFAIAGVFGILSMILCIIRIFLAIQTFFPPSIESSNNSTSINGYNSEVYSNNSFEIILKIFWLVPTFFLNLFYINSLLLYLLQSQMIIFYFNAIIQRIRFNELNLKDAIKEIELGHEFLKKLNNNTAIAISLNMLNNLISCVIAAFQANNSLNSPEDNTFHNVAVIFILFNFFRWVILFVAPLIQAMMVTANLKGIRKLGLFLKTRPFGHMITPVEELNSFQMYSGNIPLSAKLFAIPIYPWMVAILSLIALMTVLVWLNTDQRITAFWI